MVESALPLDEYQKLRMQARDTSQGGAYATVARLLCWPRTVSPSDQLRFRPWLQFKGREHGMRGGGARRTKAARGEAEMLVGGLRESTADRQYLTAEARRVQAALDAALLAREAKQDALKCAARLCPWPVHGARCAVPACRGFVRRLLENIF